MTKSNYGIIATDVSAQQLAVGTNAQINVSSHEATVSARVEALLLAIDGFEGEAETRDALTVAGADIAKALENPEARKDHVLGRLSTLASAAGSVGAIATAARALAAIL